jgi:phenylalanyl-tRNA synthetase alpha chain
LNLSEFKSSVSEIERAGSDAISTASDQTALDEAKGLYLGRKSGRLTECMRALPSLSMEERREAGALINEVKGRLETLLDEKVAAMQRGKSQAAAGDLVEPALQGAGAVQQFVEPLAERARALRDFHGVAQRHLLEGEDHAVARALFDAHGPRRNLRELASPEQPAKLVAPERLLPTLVRLPLIPPLPVNISLVPKPFRKEPQKLSSTPPIRQRGFPRNPLCITIARR